MKLTFKHGLLGLTLAAFAAVTLVPHDAEAAREPLDDHLELNFTLSRDDRLVHFVIHAVVKRRIFLVQRGETDGEFVLVAFGPQPQRTMDIRCGIFDFVQNHRLARTAQRVAGVCRTQLHDRTEIARAELLHRRALVAVEEVELAEPLGGLPR